MMPTRRDSRDRYRDSSYNRSRGYSRDRYDRPRSPPRRYREDPPYGRGRYDSYRPLYDRPSGAPRYDSRDRFVNDRYPPSRPFEGPRRPMGGPRDRPFNGRRNTERFGNNRMKLSAEQRNELRDLTNEKIRQKMEALYKDDN